MTTHSHGFWQLAGKRLLADKVARVCGAILATVFPAGAGQRALVWIASDWSDEVGVSYANPSFMRDAPNPQGQDSRFKTEQQSVDAETRAIDPLAPYYADIDKGAKAYETASKPLSWSLPLGGDKWGRDVLQKAIKAGQVSISIGVACAALLAVSYRHLARCHWPVISAAASTICWSGSTTSSPRCPYILLVLAFAAVLGKGISTVILVLGLTGWTGCYRLIRSEYIKQRSREYVEAAGAIGAGTPRIMFIHILPNVSHLILVQLSQLVVEFIKAEVILSFLGFGVPVELISWGSMINEVLAELVLGKWWQLATTALVMSTFVVAFGLFTDVLRDALDPKMKRN
jgi:ABC-type dipeptide/oligopeptide/nickel transport system permease subunit